MTEELRRRVRYGEAFWRAHHEAWKRSELNQQEYCEAERTPGIGSRPKLRTEPKCNAWTLTRNAPFRLNCFFALNENLAGLGAPQVPSKANGNIHEPWTRTFWSTYLTRVPIGFMAAYGKRPCRRGC